MQNGDVKVINVWLKLTIQCNLHSEVLSLIKILTDSIKNPEINLFRDFFVGIGGDKPFKSKKAHAAGT